MLPLFEIDRPGKSDDLAVAKMTKTTKKTTTSTKIRGSSILDTIKALKDNIDKYLGQYRDRYTCIREEDSFIKYIDACLDNGVMSLDTETTGLDVIDDDIVGFSIYTPGQKGAYIPLNHINYITHDKLDNQLDIDFVREQLKRVEHLNETVEFNAGFDTRVVRRHIGNNIVCTWDCSLASRLLNENEPVKKLKPLHRKYCRDGEDDAFSFGELFKDTKFNLIPIDIAYMYAANDAVITYELYEFQKQFLNFESDREDFRKLYWVFKNIEMPVVQVVADMEDLGVDFDKEYAKQLSVKYNGILSDNLNHFYEVIEPYQDAITVARRNGKKLDNPINIGSTQQMAILLYDIIGLEPTIDKKTKKPSRGTGEEILRTLNHPVCEAILDYRGTSKLLSTYIDKLPNECKADGRIHGRFNQYGADTGRFSSSDPNLQNIPSHNKDIRKMFKATDGYVLMSSDFSQQEPKALAALCKLDGDSQMYDTFMQGKDLYSEIASKAFNKPYEECKEFREDGSTNKEGKERRSQAKSILLGVLYGRGVASIAEQLNTTPEKAQAIKDSVFRGFPAIKKFEHDSIVMSQQLGYVTTVCGRKRRLPSMTLPDYEVKWKDGPVDDDPLAFDSKLSDEVPIDVQRRWINKVLNAPFKQRRKIFEQANAEGLWIVDNTKSKDTTKVVNARIQGSAADLTKLAMVELANNKRLKELGFRLLIQVHDEVIAECPEENMEECSKLLAETMSYAAERILEMPIKCDVEITKCWYGESI